MTIRVLIVDDSAMMRQLLTELLGADPEIEVIGAAPDPFVARDRIKSLNPDVITLDVEMPRMDGLDFLRKIIALRPMPVVMVSSLTQKGAETTLEALSIGAVDFVAKPTLDLQSGMTAQAGDLRAKVKAAARAKVRGGRRDAAPTRLSRPFQSTEKVVAIGASTGGVETLTEIVRVMPANAPAMLVTQHMPPDFTRSFARRLDGLCAVSVAEAEDGQRALPGHIYLAPGDRHLELARSGANYVCRLRDGELVSGHKPSVDVLFNSVAGTAGANAIGVILTGMGRDGARGLKAMRDAGADTIGQDEATCVVYGMPKAAQQNGAVQRELPLSAIASTILDACAGTEGMKVRV